MAIQISISNAVGSRDVVSSGGGVDPDAQAFITAAAITDPTQQNAINTLVVDLKGYNVWSKFNAIYPMVGGTATTHKFNLRNPLDTDAALRLVFSGGWTHTTSGATPNGTNAYADTKLNLGGAIPDNWHMAYYSRTESSVTGIDMGALDYSDPTFARRFYQTNRLTPAFGVIQNQEANRAFYNQSSTRSFVCTSRTSSTSLKLYTNGTLRNTNTVSSAGSYNGLPNANIYIGALSYTLNLLPQGGISFVDRQCAFASIGTGLSDTEALNFYTAVQAFQTTLGRSIGTQTVSDADAQAFVTAANIVDQVEANAINNLVIGMKADGLWTKMKAVYPFVGGTAATHKFNLKNPLNTDAAFRLLFNGGWTHSANGALPNGTNAYADTFLNVSTQTNLNDFHFSFYSRVHSAVNSIDIGAATTGVSNFYLMQHTGTIAYSIINQSLGATYASYADTDSRGLYLGTRNGTVIKAWKSGTLKNTLSPATTATRPNKTIYIAALNEQFIGFYSNRQQAFTSIGDGLTDTEASNFYTAVQAFQTALNRNV